MCKNNCSHVKPEGKFVIYSKHESLYWNNTWGWVDKPLATRFSGEQMRSQVFIPGTNSIWIKV